MKKIYISNTRLSNKRLERQPKTWRAYFKRHCDLLHFKSKASMYVGASSILEWSIEYWYFHFCFCCCSCSCTVLQSNTKYLFKSQWIHYTITAYCLRHSSICTSYTIYFSKEYFFFFKLKRRINFLRRQKLNISQMIKWGLNLDMRIAVLEYSI